MNNDILCCGHGCVFCVKVRIVNKHSDARIFEKHKCLLGHGRGEFVRPNDFCSWASTDAELLKEIQTVIQLNGTFKIGAYNHFSSRDNT